MKKVIIIDDAKFITQPLRILMESEKINAIECNDPTIAVKLIHDEKPDLIMLDLMMPLKSGADIYKEIKEDPETKDIPVFIISARADIDKLDVDLRPSDAFIKKPYDNKTVLKDILEKIN